MESLEDEVLDFHERVEILQRVVSEVTSLVAIPFIIVVMITMILLATAHDHKSPVGIIATLFIDSTIAVPMPVITTAMYIVVCPCPDLRHVLFFFYINQERRSEHQDRAFPIVLIPAAVATIIVPAIGMLITTIVIQMATVIVIVMVIYIVTLALLSVHRRD